MPRPNSVLHEEEEFTGETRVQGRRLYAATNQRSSVLVREQRGGRAFVTPAGREFFSKWVAELLPRVPVKWIVPQGKVEIDGVMYDKFHAVPPPNGPDYLPLTAETFRTEVDAGREEYDAKYFALGKVPYNGRSAQHEIEEASRAKVLEWIGAKQTVGERFNNYPDERGLGPYKDMKIVMSQYTGFYVYDSSRSILYDARASHMERGRLDVALLFDRPLRAQQPYVPSDLEHIKGICSQAFYLPKGNCVVEQLWRCLKTKTRVGKRKKGWTNLLNKQEVEADMDEAFKELGFQSGELPFDFDRGKGWRGGGVHGASRRQEAPVRRLDLSQRTKRPHLPTQRLDPEKPQTRGSSLHLRPTLLFL